MEERNEAIEVIENAANSELDRINEESNSGIGKLIGIGVLAAGAIITGSVLFKKKLKKRKAEKEACEDLDDDYDEDFDDFEEVEATEAEPEKEEKSEEEK